MLRNQDLVPVLCREHSSGVKAHADGGHMRTQFLGGRCEFITATLLAELRIGNIPTVAIGVAKVKSRTRRPVELIRGTVVAQPVPTVIGEPELPGFRMPVKPHGISDPVGEYLQTRPVRPHAQHRSVAFIFRPASITGGSHWHIKPAIRPHGDESPAVAPVPGKAIPNQHRIGGIRQPGFNAVKAPHLMGFRHVEVSLMKSHTVGRAHLLGQGDDLVPLVISIGVHHRIDGPLSPGADKKGAVGTQGHGTSVRNITGVKVDAESGRKLNEIQTGLHGGRRAELSHQRRSPPQAHNP